MSSSFSAVASRPTLLVILLSACAWALPSRAAEPGSQTAANGGWVLAPKRPPHSRDIKPGQLSQNEKRKRFSELSRRGRTQRRAAFYERVKRFKALEAKFGIYDVATLLDNGNVSKRVDIVIVSAGFSKRDAAAVNARAEKLKNALLRIDPFRNYPAYINVHRVNVNDGSLATARIKTKVSLNENALTCDRSTAKQYAQHAPDADLVVVLCNIKGVRSTGRESDLIHAFVGILAKVVQLGGSVGAPDQLVVPHPDGSQPGQEWGEKLHRRGLLREGRQRLERLES